MANNLTVTYKGSTIHSASASGSATLETGGTWCEGDIGLSYTFDEGNLVVTVLNGTATSVTAVSGGSSVSLTYDSTGDVWRGTVSAGTWTVTATDGTHTNSKSVTIAAAQVYALSIFLPDAPLGYTQVEYLQSQGEQYINTGVNATSELKWDAFFSITSAAQSNQRNYLIGQSWGTGRTQFSYSSQAFFGWGSSIGTQNITVDTNLHHVVVSKHGFVLDGVLLKTFSGAFSSLREVYLYAMNANGPATTIANGLKIHALKVSDYTTGIVYRDFIPCKRTSDDVAGLYDLINNEFYTNAGSGSFILGPAVA